jgi:hypothetical protein
MLPLVSIGYLDRKTPCPLPRRCGRILEQLRNKPQLFRLQWVQVTIHFQKIASYTVRAKSPPVTRELDYPSKRGRHPIWYGLR